MREIDANLLENVKKGDKESFASLIALYQDWALRMAYLHVSNWQDAEEIAQDAFVKVFKKIDTFKGESKFSSWLYRILINQCYSHLRKVRTKRMMGFWGKPDQDPVEQVRAKGDPGKSAMNQELKEALDQAISKLPPRQKTVFILHYLDGRKLNEIAEILKTAEGSVKANLFQARQKLKTVLKG